MAFLFEPCFEISNLEGRKRMERLGYIKNIDGAVKELGGKIVEKIILNKINFITFIQYNLCFYA